MLNRSHNPTNAGAIVLTVLGMVIMLAAAWLVVVNVRLNALGTIAAFDGSVTIHWGYWFPYLVGVDDNSAMGMGAGILLGLLVTSVQFLTLTQIIDWDRLGTVGRLTVVAITVYDLASTIWGLMGGVFLDLNDPISSLIRFAMASALTIFAFSVGAERWMVLGWNLTSHYGMRVLVNARIVRRPQEQRKHEPEQRRQQSHVPPDLLRKMRSGVIGPEDMQRLLNKHPEYAGVFEREER